MILAQNSKNNKIFDNVMNFKPWLEIVDKNYKNFWYISGVLFVSID